MIYTVTFNPSLDYIMRVPSFQLGIVNRTESEDIQYGGKGINVSNVLRNLGVESVTLGFVAGFTGAEIERGVRKMGCNADFIRVKKGISRINVKLKAEVETEINAVGPVITSDDVQLLIEKLEVLKQGDYLVLAGSIPPSLPQDVYAQILGKLLGRGAYTVVDATGSLLLSVLSYRPFLIKPNHHELGELFRTEIRSDADLRHYANLLQKQGARNVLVSLAGEGAFLLDENGASYRLPAPKGKVRNSTGAGDSMVAGFIAGYLQTGDYQKAFYMSVAVGSSSAFSNDLTTGEEARALLTQIEQQNPMH